MKSCTKSNLVYSKDFGFYKYHNINKFVKRSFYSKENDLSDFKDIWGTFYYNTQELNPNNESHKKDVEKRRAVINTASKLHNKLLNRYSTQ